MSGDLRRAPSWDVADRAFARVRLPLVRNAVVLMGNAGVTAGLGFFFWALVARLYTPSQVGLASATIAAALFVATVTQFGLHYALVRFGPEAGPQRATLNSTVMTVVMLAGIGAGAIFAAGISIWEPTLLQLASQGALAAGLMAIAGATGASTVLVYVAVSARDTRPALAGGVTQGVVKFVLVLVLATAVPGAGFGIVVAWLLGTVAAVGLQSIALRRHLAPHVDVYLLRRGRFLYYSAGNYVGDLLWTAPGLLFPLIVVNLFGAAENAYFYVAWSIAGLLVAIPTAVGSSLLAEASHSSGETERHVRRAFVLTLVLVGPGIVLAWLAAPYLLVLFGPAYAAQGLETLRVLAITALPLSINLIFLTEARVDRATPRILAITASTGIGSLVLGAALGLRAGEIGIAVGYLIAHTVTATILTVQWRLGRRSAG